jgi:hypothetical protein
MKRATSIFLCLALIGNLTLFADEAVDPVGPKEVGKASQEGVEAGKSSAWVTYTVAGIAIAVAITALILVSRNQGHSSN